MSSSARTIHRVCTLCEATCGIDVEVEGDRVVTIRGDKHDPFSRGYICPKAYGLKALQDDPDRLRAPMIKRGGTWVEASWDEALRAAIAGLTKVRDAHGPDAIAAYLGNPAAHSLHAMLYGSVLLRALGSKQLYSASSLDQLPRQISSGLLFGGALTIPVPDLDRTDFLLVIGANPLASNGSLMTAPDVPARLAAIRDRGALIVIDPRRTETARIASEHHFIRPGTDALLVLAMIHVVLAEERVRLRRAAPYVDRLDALAPLVGPFSPEAVAARCGIDAPTIRRLARALASAERGVCYGRIGTTCQPFGTLTSWAIDVLNILCGHLDVPGGAMFTTPAALRGGNRRPSDKGGRGVALGRWKSRVLGLPESFGELPTSTLADEILTEGEGQVRAMITVAGNPLLSAPNAARLEQAFARLEFAVAIDIYLNETTRHAHVILPPPPPLERDTYDLALYQLAVRNVAKYSPPALPRAEGRPDEWEILLALASGLMGTSGMDLGAVDDLVIARFVEQEVGDGGRWEGLTKAEALEKLAGRRGPARMLDLLLRTGAHGDGFGRRPGGLSLDALERAPHGVDLGPLEPRLPEVLRTPGARIDLVPALITADLARLERSLVEESPPTLLIGRRHLRSNNSWMHNLTALVKGPARCTLLLHPDDAARAGLRAGDRARITSRVGSVVAPVEISDEMMPGVVSLPHGWGHDVDGIRAGVARRHAGVNVNALSDDAAIDAVSGNAAFNGIPVRVEREDGAARP